MKKMKITLTIMIAVFAFLLVSCDRDITEPVISSNPTQPAQSDLSLTVAFDVNNADSLVRFTWAAADFGFPSSTTYTVEVSPTSGFTANVATLLTTQKLTGTAKIGDLNALMLSWGYNIGSAVTVYYRTAASVSSNAAAAYSAVKSVSLTPYDAVIVYPMIYAPGAYQGWSPGAVNGRLYSYNYNTTYTNIIRLIDGTNPDCKFKITPAANWDNDWGGNIIKTGNNYSGILIPKAPDNISVSPGCYVVTFNTSTLAITLTKTDDWGIIGDAVPTTGWGSSVAMFYNGQRKMWEITADFNAGAFKFRANDAWTTSYGDGNHDGILDTSNDNNIPITTAGNYTIRFNPVTLEYTVKKN